MENKVTIERIVSVIDSECYMVLPDGRTTLCILSLQNGYTVKGMSACVDANSFDLNIGRKFAFDDAIRQIWPLEGYLLAQRLYENTRIGNVPVPVFEEITPVLNKPVAKKTAPAKKRGAPAKAKRAKFGVVAADDAPYGYKKDGTPKKRPGRKAA